MSVEALVINVAFFVAGIVLAKPVVRLFNSSTADYKFGISSRIEKLESELSSCKVRLREAIAMDKNLENDIFLLLEEAKGVSESMQERAKLKAESMLESRIEGARLAIAASNKAFLLSVKKMIMDSVSDSLSKIACENLRESDHKKIVNSLSMTVLNKIEDGERK